MQPTMEGKTVLITGANSGIGKVTALELARRGAQVVASARHRAKGEAAVSEIRRQSGNDQVGLLIADLQSMDEVRDLAQRFLAGYSHLDVLIHNAGLMLSRPTETPDGYEATFAVNHLAPFLLTRLLLPRLKRRAPSRVITVASRAHFRASLDFDDLHNRRGYHGFRVYSQSKLANVLFTRELARRLQGTGVTANCLHPGVVRTGFGADGDATGWFALAIRCARPFFISPEKGAETSVYLAVSPQVEGVTGKYFDQCRQAPSSRQASDMEAAERLWRASEELTSKWA